MLQRFNHSMAKAVLASSLICAGLTALIQTIPSYAQRPSNVENELIQEVLPLRAEALTTIREAPFSELFSIDVANGITAYAVKDKDFDPRYDGVGLYSLWGVVPSREVLQATVFYCFRNPALAETVLESITFIDGDETLVTLDQEVVATQAESVEVVPERTVITEYRDPFFNPYWGSSFFGGRTVYTTTYLPAVNCSVGGGRFDMHPVSDAISNLPSQTLDVRLLFSNGRVENWRLGRRTVEEIKRLPSLE